MPLKIIKCRLALCVSSITSQHQTQLFFGCCLQYGIVELFLRVLIATNVNTVLLDFQVLFSAKNAAHQSKFGCDIQKDI